MTQPAKEAASAQAHAQPHVSPTMGGAWGWTVGLGVLLLGVAIWALPRTIQPGDAGEFATVMLEGGVPHPSGYPWMRILGWVARSARALGLPPATAAALGPSGLGIAGWLLLHRVALRLSIPASGQPSPATAALATFAIALPATSPVVVLHTHDSEVWGPLTFFAALLVWLALVRRARAFVLGLAFGLALSHHLTAALLLPICVASAWPRGGRPIEVLRAALRGIAGGVLGLSPYLTLMIGDGQAWRWGDTTTWTGLIHHVSRADYGVLSLSLHTQAVSALDQLARVSSSIGGTLSAGLVPLAIPAGMLVVLVLVMAARAAPPTVRRQDVFGLWGAAVASTWLFALAHNIDPRNPFGAWILERFDILSLAVLAPLLAAAAAPVTRALAGRRRAGIGLAICGALLVLRQLVVTAWHGVPSSDNLVQRYAEDLLATPPRGGRAVVFGTDDHRLFPVTFAQEVLGLGPAILYVDASLLAHPWYREHLRRRFPELPDVDKPVRLMQALWEDPQWRDTPIYLTNDFSLPSRSLPRVPEGILWRVLPPHQIEVEPLPVLQRHKAALQRYGAPPRGPLMEGHPFSADLSLSYTEGTGQLARALAAQGMPEQGEALLREALAPSSPSAP